MSGPRDPRLSNAEQAARLADLLVTEDPAGAEALAAGAARHFERTRRGRQRPHAAATAAPRVYLHEEPTGSPVLNAFLHQFGAGDLVPADVAVFDEHRLAPRLVECARRQLASMLAAGGDAETGLFFAGEIPPITSAHAARMYLRQAAAAGEGELGAIARDYEEHRRREGAPEHDDRLGSAIMAAFAGRLLSYATRILGTRVREDVRASLGKLTSAGKGPTRHRSVSAPRTPSGAVPVPGPKKSAG